MALFGRRLHRHERGDPWLDLELYSSRPFPSLQRRGGCGINQKSRSHRRAADGVVAHATRFTNAFRSIACERPPRPRLLSERIHFANGASTPPLQGGECTYPKSVSNMKWDTTLACKR